MAPQRPPSPTRPCRRVARLDPGYVGAHQADLRRTRLRTPSRHGSAVATLKDLYAQLRIVAVDEPLAGDVGDLAAEHTLRGYDAVNLARDLVGDDILLAAWDNALNAAGRVMGQPTDTTGSPACHACPARCRQ